MAIEEAGSKVGSFVLKYEDLDDATAAAGQWTAEKEAANADQAIKDPDVMVYIGTYNSGAAKVSMPKLNQAGILMVSPANTWPGLTKPGKGDPGEPEKYRPSGKINYVRCVPADDIQGVVSAEWAKKLGLLKVFILDDREVYGKGIADLFQAPAGDRWGYVTTGSTECVQYGLLRARSIYPDAVAFYSSAAHYKVPRYVRFVDEFPMTVTGKIQKYKMREWAIAELGLEDAAAVQTA